MKAPQIEAKLVSAVTQYDEKQSKRKYWNPYALPKYLECVDRITSRIEAGESEIDAICAETTADPLRTAMLKALGHKADYRD